jgi:hypothetical protein
LICLSVLLVVTSSDTVPTRVLNALSAFHPDAGADAPRSGS